MKSYQIYRASDGFHENTKKKKGRGVAGREAGREGALWVKIVKFPGKQGS